MTTNPLSQDFKAEDFGKKSEDFYNTSVKSNLEPSYNGKYVALDYESGKYWIGETVSEAIEKAKKEYPQKLFYVVQVGSPTTFSIQSGRHPSSWA